MKTLLLAFLAALALTGCGEVIPDGNLILELPPVPRQWEEILGRAHWRVEYMSTLGLKVALNLRPGEITGLELPQTWTSAVLAFPYWPERYIPAGAFKPAGALFPFDALVDEDGSGIVRASWRAGIDAFLYWELAQAAAIEIKALEAKIPRLPANFNWPRFRELMASEDIAEADDPRQRAIHADPWLADWQSIAVKIAASGFDKRRVKSRPTQEQALPVPCGAWLGTSPFAAPLVFEEGESPVFPVGEETEYWVSGAGMLRVNKQAWFLHSW